MSKSEILPFYNKRKLMLDGYEFETPMLLPSFSSKGFESSLPKTIEYASKFITDAILVSIYDIARSKVDIDVSFAELIFMDSGGYESSSFRDMPDRTGAAYTNKDWTIEEYKEHIKEWRSLSPTVFVSYDHPKARQSLKDQIDSAKDVFDECAIVNREILFKPETESANFVDFKKLISMARGMNEFSVIGVTEKEAGNSILERMKNIALLRRALRDCGLDTPIHIFGSLDPITSVLYFLAGADIFDGLTWLRYAYRDDDSLYYQNWGALRMALNSQSTVVEANMWQQNYNCLQELSLKMKRFASEGDFQYLGGNAEFFSKAYLDMKGKL